MTDHTGRRGRLRLVFERRSGTVLAEQSFRAPFHVQRAIHCDERLPEMAYLYLMSTSGGTLGGDSHRMEIAMKENTMAHVTTQGATRVYKTHGEGASLATDITLAGNSYLEFMPDQTIPYGGSSYSQTASISASRTATLVYADVVTSGRRAMGESFQYDVFRTDVTAHDEDGGMIFWDAAVLEPAKRDVAKYGILGDCTVTGSLYVLAPRPHTPILYERINRLVSGNASVPGGASMMRDNAGVLVRLLGSETRAVMGVARRVAGAVRDEMLGAPLWDDRKS